MRIDENVDKRKNRIRKYVIEILSSRSFHDLFDTKKIKESAIRKYLKWNGLTSLAIYSTYFIVSRCNWKWIWNYVSVRTRTQTHTCELFNTPFLSASFYYCFGFFNFIWLGRASNNIKSFLNLLKKATTALKTQWVSYYIVISTVYRNRSKAKESVIEKWIPMW